MELTADRDKPKVIEDRIETDTSVRMPRITIDVSSDDLTFIESEVGQSSIASASELIRLALKEYRRVQALDEVDRLLDEALENDETTEITPEYWERKKKEFLARRRATAQ